MLKNRLIKTVGLILPIFLLTMGCRKDPVTTQPAEKDLATFEKEYSNSLTYTSDNSIKLIGFKKIKLSSKELGEFLLLSKNYKNKLHNYYFDEVDRSMRIYFPVEAALVEHNNTLVEASENGELKLDGEQTDIEHFSVVGRKQTPLVTGVEGNDIRNGIIYLAQKNKSDHHIGNMYVFDFGYKMIMEHNHSGTNGTMEKASCMSNHGGGRNCSVAFNIYQGRCTFNSSVCMDYNGWFTNCVNGKWSNFPGSDCDYALGAGHCWNEVM